MKFFKGIIPILIIMVNGFSHPPIEKNRSHEEIFFNGWHYDIDKAEKVAKESQKPLLVAFLGPEWCKWSDQLEEEVLSTNAFLNSLKDVVVLLRIDIPENFDQEEFVGFDLKKKYHIKKCPSFVLIQPSGKEIAKLDYQSSFADTIKKRITDYERICQMTEKKELKKLGMGELKTLYSQAGKLADSTFKKVLLKEGLKSDQGSFFLLEEYGDLLAKGERKKGRLHKIRSKIISRDPGNNYGVRRELALLEFEALANEEKPHKAKTVINPLVEYLSKFGVEDIENGWRLEMKISQYLFSRNLVEDALKHAQASLKMAPDAAQSQVNESIEYLKALHK